MRKAATMTGHTQSRSRDDQQAHLIELLSKNASSEAHRFLSDMSSASWGPGAPIETHISWVYLTPDRAYKLKKPVALSFLDFSTLQARERACRRELEVNRAFAPDLYLGLRPILATPHDGVRFGPLLTDPNAATPEMEGGAIIDWVVEMRRFDREGEFDTLAARGALTPDLMRRLADKISAAHIAAPKPADPGQSSHSAPWRATLAQVAEALGAAGLEKRAEAWRARAEATLATIESRLEARRRHGFFRRLHGDLHLGNICLLDGEPTLFDAIEFDDRLATIDPLYDVAFAAMDLIWRGAPDLSQIMLSRYLAATRDYGGLIGWPLFLSLRAAIRAMAAATKGDRQTALAKLDFAERLLAPRSKPRLVTVAGLSGSGKSTLAAAIAPELAPLGCVVVVSSDVVRKRLFGQAPETPLPKEAYRPEVSASVYRRMLIDARRALRAGAAVMLDGVFARRADRDAARRLADSLDVDFQGLWLETPLETRLERVAHRAASPKPDASDADQTVARAQSGGLDPEEPGWRAAPDQTDAAATKEWARSQLGLASGSDLDVEDGRD